MCVGTNCYVVCVRVLRAQKSFYVVCVCRKELLCCMCVGTSCYVVCVCRKKLLCCMCVRVL